MKTPSRFRSVPPLFPFVALLSLAATAFSTEPYRVGSTVAAFSAKDQFGAPFKLDGSYRALLISFDMETGKQANVKLSALGKDFLPQHRAVYVANIDGMPAIGRAFALPKMRKYSHRIVLADSLSLLAPFPKQERRVTVLSLRQGKVTGIRYWDPATEEPAKVLGGK